MSFFRVLLALMISGGIAYGLYRAVDGKGVEQVVEAVRSEIEVSAGKESDPKTEATSGEAANRGATDTEVAETGGVENASGQENAEAETAESEPMALVAEVDNTETEFTATGTGGDEAAASTSTETKAITSPTPSDGSGAADSAAESAPEAEAEPMELTASTASTDREPDEVGTEVAEGERATAPPAADAAAPDDAQGDTEENAASFATRTEENIAAARQSEPETDKPDETGSQNDIPRIAALPSPPDALLPDDAQAPAALAGQMALPAARIEAAPSVETPSTDVLDVVSGGMSYGEARETLIAAGWVPRVPEWRTTPTDPAEIALIDAGYAELEGCKGDERPLCRFEFMDGEKRIAAILTAGTGTDPSVIDAFLMNILAE